MRRNDRFLSLLGMSRRAGQVALGYQRALDAIHRGAACVIFCAEDLSETTRRGLDFACEACAAQTVGVPYTIEELSAAVGMKTGIAAVCDAGFTRKMMQLLQETDIGRTPDL